MREIPLSQGLFAIVDDDNYERIAAIASWSASRNAKANTFYAVARPDGKMVRMHWLVIDVPPGMLPDHRNLNGLDNRRENLRLATKQQNVFNYPKRGVRSRFKGVWPAGPSWCAMVARDGKRHYLGTFPTEVEAAVAYDAAAVQIHGEFARTNAMMFPELMEGQR